MSWRDLGAGEVRPEHVGRRLTLAGWVGRRRDHGGLVFIDLRDRAGLCQLVVNPERAPEAHASTHEIRNEFVLRVEGEIVARVPEAVNPDLPTGGVELQVDFLRTAMADSCERVPGVRRVGARSVAYAGDDYVQIYKLYLAMIDLAQAATS